MITDNYIKMCEKNEDLQEAWKPCEGSWVKRIDYKDPYVLDYDADRTICYAFDCDWIKKVNPNPEFIKWYDQRGENYVIWTPTLEQLFSMVEKQKKVKDHYKDVHFIFRLNWFLSGKYINDTKQPAFVVLNNINPKYDCSIQEYVLAFVMYEKYKKIWTGEKWVEETN